MTILYIGLMLWAAANCAVSAWLFWQIRATRVIVRSIAVQSDALTHGEIMTITTSHSGRVRPLRVERIN